MMYSFDFEDFRKKVESLGITVRQVQREIGITNYNTARHILDFDEGSLLSRILQFCNTYDIRFEDYLMVDGMPIRESVSGCGWNPSTSTFTPPQVENPESKSVNFSTSDPQFLHPDLHLQSELLAVILKHNESVSKQNNQQLIEAYERMITDKDRQIAEWKARAERLERMLNESPTPDAINTYINDRAHAYKSLNR